MTIVSRLRRWLIGGAIEFCYLFSKVPGARGYGRLRNVILRFAKADDPPYKVRRRGVKWKLYLQGTSYLDRQVLFSGVYEREGSEFVERLIERGWHCFDVGANVGYYTLLMAKRAGNSGRIYAFEPVQEFRDRLIGHIELNRMHNVTVAPLALSDSEGAGTIYVTSVTGKMKAPPAWEVSHTANKLERTTLDRYCEVNNVARVDFVKVDIDGHESAFLSGAEKTLARHLPIVLIEVAPRDNPRGMEGVIDLCERLLVIGYRLCSEDGARQFPAAAEAVAALMKVNKNGGNLVCMPDRAIGQPPIDTKAEECKANN